MKLYELIIALHPSLSTEESNALLDKLEGLFEGGIQHKDDIGYQKVYSVHGVKTGSQLYFVSYILNIDPAILPDVRQKMSLMKGLIRSLFLSRSSKDPVIVYKDINESFVNKLSELASKDKKAKKTKDQKQQLLDTAKDVEIEIQEDSEEEAKED